jgi:hypothetical protein
MKRLFIPALVMFSCALPVQAEDVTVEAIVAKDKDSEPTDTFAPNVPQVYAFFKTKGSKKGDKFRAVWIAEDVGDSAPPDTKNDEATLTADKDDFFGAFSLSKPTKGWPLGDYRVDIYNGDQVAISVSFTIEEEEADTSDKEEDSSDH